ncbi:unnamed protein product [Dracunculus medinensis]|uniref:Protein DIS3 homolog n=1 Tax=Dracunculus medinensis TaxID=318479 RepID=A0A158Q6L7_DRAME|nr:unnamed protein product [Dracunculus medinensis]
MFEINVKQSGICGRELNIVYRKNRSGKIVKRVHEHYLRNDISCNLAICQKCRPFNTKIISDLKHRITSTFPANHAVIVDSATVIRFHHLFDSDRFKNVILTQTVWNDVKKSNPPAYKTINSLCYERANCEFVVFLDDLHYMTHLSGFAHESREKRLDKSLLKVAKFYEEHWANYDIIPIILCATDDKKDKLKLHFTNTFTLKEYVEGMGDNADLLNKIAIYNSEAENHSKLLFPEHYSHEVIQDGIHSGKFKKATFQISRENYLEATARLDGDVIWFIQGRINCNRAINGDTVAVELLPEDQWTCPEKLIRASYFLCRFLIIFSLFLLFLKLRDLEELEAKNEIEKDDEEREEKIEPDLKKVRIEDRIPSAKVVGIIKRNWRQYCGMILKPSVPGTLYFYPYFDLFYSTNVLFTAAERLIPRIRLETRQTNQLLGKRIIAAIDRWPRDSRYPVGHYVRTIGVAGDRDIENEVVLLLEHDIPHDQFSDFVLACLPSIPWIPPVQTHRKDLRSLFICSVDPPGCTDIDDALHCRQLSSDQFEVGVHIADVTHFVRPGTAIDEEAAHRGTTVYLCDKRIDMLPELLSSDLCSLRENVDRFAFSVIWTLSSNADIINVQFHKSIIRSRGALTYEMAQNMIDDPYMNDEITLSLRGLIALSKKLKARRHASGALNLASSEIRFDIDNETKNPISVQEKMHLDTNSMVEEFMLLANISVAEKICAEFPDCALLRRHPTPSVESYKSLVEMTDSLGFKINIESGKALAESLDRAIDPNNSIINTLIRMLTTRCLTQAVYFSSGSLPTEQYTHFGLAAPIYTHFTSPIRRYADIMVHRLLSAAIKADITVPSMLKGDIVSKIANNLNYRHKQAQYAGRASLLLNTLLYFKDRVENHEAFVMGIRKNGIQVFVPKYGLESVIVFPSNLNYSINHTFIVAEGIKLFLLQKILVKLSLDETDLQHIRIDMKLISPKIPGFSVDYMISFPEDS